MNVLGLQEIQPQGGIEAPALVNANFEKIVWRVVGLIMQYLLLIIERLIFKTAHN
jgi:hypothetical protein